MEKDIIKIGLRAEVENIDEIEQQVKDLQGRLNNMKINLVVSDKKDSITITDVLNLEETIIRQIRWIKSKIENSWDVGESATYNNYTEYNKNIQYILQYLIALINIKDPNIRQELMDELDIFVDSEANKLHLSTRNKISIDTIKDFELLQALTGLSNIRKLTK